MLKNKPTILIVEDEKLNIDVLSNQLKDKYELIIAKKFLKSFYPERKYLLFAGVAEHLPFREKFFSNVLAIDVIEHVLSQKQFIEEAYRVLVPDGYFYFDTDSRFTWKEPHTNLSGLGCLPRFLQPPYVYLTRHRSYKIHLPSIWELRKWLNKSPFMGNWKIIHDKIDPTSKPKTWRGKLLRLFPWNLSLRNMLVMTVSHYRVIAKRGGSYDTQEKNT